MAAAAAAAANTCRRCYMFARAFSSAAAVNGTDKMAMIRTLRAHTGAPISEVHLDRPSVVIIASYDVKASLEKSGYDEAAALDDLRVRGIAAAGKRAASSRVAAEGLLMLVHSSDAAAELAGGRGALEAVAIAELNCETDFVARNSKFQDVLVRFASSARDLAADTQRGDGGTGGCVVQDDLLGLNDRKLHCQVQPMCEELSATVREKVEARRAKAMIVSAEAGGSPSGIVGSYVHAGSGLPVGMGRICSAVSLMRSATDAASPAAAGSEDHSEELRALATSIAMHVAGMRPRYVTPADVPEQEVASERAVLTAQAQAEGKPAKVVAKMVEGRLRKMYDDICLSKQRLVTDPETTVEEAVSRASGGAYRLGTFLRMEVGEGVDKEEKDFASEVKEQVQKAS